MASAALPNTEAGLAAEIKAATDMAATDPEGAAERVAYLRARGVEVDLPEERNRPAPPATGPPFAFVYVPADIHTPVKELKAPCGVGDTLPNLLGPCFDDNAALDQDTVERETASRLKNMMVGGAKELNGKTLKSPSAAAIQDAAAGGKSESYPLMQASAENGWRGVRLYIDEIGALRQRPRNTRAEELATAAGLAGLAIHGDAYVGRCGRPEDGSLPEHNFDFKVEELAHTSEWVGQARAANLRQAVQAGIGDTEHLPSGGDEDGPYSWSQTDDDVEVRVRGAPTGKGAGKRVKVGFGRGESLSIAVDGAKLLSLEKLFAKVTPDDCNWSLDGDHIVITMEKAAAGRPWAGLVPLGSE